MKAHFYKNLNNSDISFSQKNESILFEAIPADTLLTEDMICLLYENKLKSKPSEYPPMTRLSVIQHIKLLNDKKFLKSFSAHELRNSLKLGR